MSKSSAIDSGSRAGGPSPAGEDTGFSTFMTGPIRKSRGYQSKTCPSFVREARSDVQVESQGNGWTAHQIWGFAEINGVRKYSRRVVVRKGKDVKRARLVYDFKEELKN